VKVDNYARLYVYTTQEIDNYGEVNYLVF